MYQKIKKDVYLHGFRGNNLIVTVLLPKEEHECREQARVAIFIKGKSFGGGYFEYYSCSVNDEELVIGFATVPNLAVAFCENDTTFQVFNQDKAITEAIPIILPLSLPII